jgi:hypothetical protein
MDFKAALIEQYRAGLSMLGECVATCPDDLWHQGEHPRAFWRIVFHAAFFTQFGLGQTYRDMVPWPGANPDSAVMWDRPEYVEPYELPEDAQPYDRDQALAYIAFVDALVAPTVFALDLEASDSGFPWEGNSSKISQQLKSLRHLQGHVGQLSELLMARGIEVEWVSGMS